MNENEKLEEIISSGNMGLRAWSDIQKLGGIEQFRKNLTRHNKKRLDMLLSGVKPRTLISAEVLDNGILCTYRKNM